ncbi:MAG: Plug domain-containing protein [Niastella sp.]|nr:Plug domain-containing protein [Niastella sp.]
MPKALKPLLTVAAAICLLHNVYSQTDTSNNTLNLGRVKLQKDFTQSITIKGEQLERMPFTNLSDALSAWTYGYFINSANVVYVIDGVVINDINAYSVYDIREVTIVQNALTQVNGSLRQQLLAVVTTRNGGAGEQGITVAGQSFQVKNNYRGVYSTPYESEKNYFHQYHLAARFNKKNVQMGISANYLREVEPMFKIGTNTSPTPMNFDRIRLNGWLNMKLGSAHDLSVRINAVPQIADLERSNVNADLSSYKGHSNQLAFNPTIALRSGLSKNLTNELTASYAAYKRKGERDIVQTSGANGNIDRVELDYRTKQVLLMDQITYHGTLDNGWSIAPSVNAMFRYTEYDNEATSKGSINGSNYVNQYNYNYDSRAFLVTPSVNIYYKNIFNIQGGLLANLSKTNGQDIEKILPFVSTSVDVWQLVQPGSRHNLKLFASYAKNTNTGDYAIRMDQHADNINFPLTIITGPGSSSPPILEPEGSYKAWQAGTRLGLLDNLLTLNYYFERRNYATPVYLMTPTGYTIRYPELSANTQHISLMINVADKNTFTFTTGINATSIRNKSKDLPGYSLGGIVIGDYNSGRTTWTGGWVNRFSCKGVIFGFDFVYYFNPDRNPTTTTNYRIDAAALQNAYIGYQFKLKGAEGFEIYADTRNPKQDRDWFQLTGSRQYYGLGFKANL